MIDLEQLLQDAPRFHVDESGRPHSWQLGRRALHFLDGKLRVGWRTLETGAGLSTVLFALKGCEHLCVVGAPREVERITAYCTARALSIKNVTFRVGASERLLPQLDLPELDLVLIDGGHAFPIPFIDWFYVAPRLKVGGILVLDDIHLWTVRTLCAFLAEEPEWRLEETLGSRSAIFLKTGPLTAREWNQQPFVRRMSDHPAPTSPARRALTLLLGGELGTLLRKVARAARRRTLG